ncbi:hypothetical protein [Brenneria tiliae]|uniref:Uncharacterized protein n=1 Tax=Brenneria tiliae TaxID=2914984 RepID=A0ABT0MRJ0_9GAMM|nr:hypothetical protein [Brenneria tiliae]MCL2892463.1 hypothetical protein [Brenneria tiliae]
MSEYGVELINDAGKPLVSTENINYFLASSGYITNSEVYRLSEGGDFFISGGYLETSEFDAPIVFLRAIEQNARCTGYARYSRIAFSAKNAAPTRNFDFGVRAHIINFWNSLQFDTPVEYYIFSRDLPLTTGGYGIEIWDSNAAKIFSSSWFPLNICGVNWYSAGSPNYANLQFDEVGPFRPGRKIATCLPLTRSAFHGTGKGWGDRKITRESSYIDPSTNKVYIGRVPTGTGVDGFPWAGAGGPWDAGIMQDGKAVLMVADVTNYPIPYNPRSFVGIRTDV